MHQPTYQHKPLRIAQVAPLWARVPPVDYGGIELFVSWLTEELVARGHEVTLFASGDSRTSARLQSVCPRNLMDSMQDLSAYHYAHYIHASLADALKSREHFDVIHCHTDIEHLPFGSLCDVPVVCTMQTALSIDDHWVVQRYPDMTFVGVSHAQIRNVPAERRQRIPVVYNSCNMVDYDFSPAPGSYLAFLGRMGKHKNPLGAIRIATMLDMPIVLAGKPQDRDEAAYFEREIRPLIDGDRVRYIGPVNPAQKRVFLRDAAALLFPIQWEEPFGIVMVEAMASGTPVVACSRGSVPELIDAGITGFHADSIEEMAHLVPQALALDRRRVRDHARQRFCHERMVDAYVQLYRSLVSRAGERNGARV